MGSRLRSVNGGARWSPIFPASALMRAIWKPRPSATPSIFRKRRCDPRHAWTGARRHRDAVASLRLLH
jgi:hypothetical protein